MTHITAYLVALTLTASPVMPTVCATICGHDSAPTAHCHEQLTEPTEAAMSADGSCGAVIADAAYINDRTTPPQGAAVSPATPSIPTLVILSNVSRVLTVPDAGGWLAPPFVLRV
jgi:hypothetical protein